MSASTAGAATLPCVLHHEWDSNGKLSALDVYPGDMWGKIEPRSDRHHDIWCETQDELDYWIKHETEARGPVLPKA